MSEDSGLDIDMEMDTDVTGYGGEYDEYGNPLGFSETGLYTSPRINASRGNSFSLPNLQKNSIKSNAYSYTNTNAPGMMLPQTWKQGDVDRVAYNQHINGGGFTPRPEYNSDGSLKLSFESSVPSGSTGSASERVVNNPPKMPTNMMPSSPLPAYSPGASNPNVNSSKPLDQQQPAMSRAPGSGGGTPGFTPRSNPVSPTTWDNIHAVEKSPPPLPFQPVIPTGNDGHNRAFYQVQEELLKALFPYWKAQQ